jgi:integrase/recombinase XerC
MNAHLADFITHLTVRGASPHTVRSYSSDLAQFFSWVDEQGLLKRGQGPEKVSYLMVRRYLAHLSSEDFSRRSVVRKLSTLKAFWKWLEMENRVKSNPAAAVISPKFSPSMPEILDRETVERLLDAPAFDKPLGRRDRALLEWMYSSGARVAETAALNLESIDWKKAEARIETGKGGGARLVMLGGTGAQRAAKLCRGLATSPAGTRQKRWPETDAGGVDQWSRASAFGSRHHNAGAALC